MNIKPCPFCGGEMWLIERNRSWANLDGDHKEDCFLADEDGEHLNCFETSNTKEGKDYLIDSWNKRARG